MACVDTPTTVIPPHTMAAVTTTAHWPHPLLLPHLPHTRWHTIGCDHTHHIPGVKDSTLAAVV
jgi:hypothetical protein